MRFENAISLWREGQRRLERAEPPMAVAQERVYVGEKRGFNHRVDVLAHTELRPYERLGSNFYARLREIETMERRDGGQRGS